jgi:hypothetical protein
MWLIGIKKMATGLITGNQIVWHYVRIVTHTSLPEEICQTEAFYSILSHFFNVPIPDKTTSMRYDRDI